MSVTWALPFETKIIPKLNSNRIVSINTYKEIHSQTVKDYKNFWASVASELDWYKPWEKVLDDSNPPFYKWFSGGEINAAY
ncbi:acetyl-coenzyme A synthetase, partial [Sulfolobus sp. F3]